MTPRVVINRPPCPLPVLARPARKWLPRDRWARQAEEARPAATSGETDAFVAKIRGLLFGGRQ